MSGILISYREGDAAGHAGRLFDRLRARLPKQPVRKDAARVAPGEDFVDAIEKAVEASDTVLVVMGREWASAASTGGRRLDDVNDPVRIEIGAALRANRRVIPVLVEGAAMPSEQTVPGDLRPLLRRQAVELRDANWDRDVESLIQALESRPRQARRAPIHPGRYRHVAATGILSVLAAIALLVGLALHTSAPEDGTPGLRVHPDLTMAAANEIGQLAALPGQRIVSLNNDELTVWDLATGESQSLYHERGMASIAPLPEGRLALGYWGSVKVFNTATREVEAEINLHDPYPDGTDTSIQNLVSLGDSTVMSFSSVSVGFCDWKARTGHVIPLEAPPRFGVLPGGRVVLLGGGGSIGVWNPKDAKPEVHLPPQADAGPQKDVAVLADGRIATTSEQGVLSLWSLETGKSKVLRAAAQSGVLYDGRLFALPDGRLAEVRDGAIEVWSVTGDKPERTAELPRRNGMYLANPLMLADGRLLLALDTGGIAIWNPRSGRTDALLEGHTKPARRFLLLADHRLASVGEDRTIRIWKLPPGGVPARGAKQGH